MAVIVFSDPPLRGAEHQLNSLNLEGQLHVRDHVADTRDDFDEPVQLDTSRLLTG